MTLDLIIGLPANELPPTYDDFVDTTRDGAKRAYDVARQYLRVAAKRRKDTYDIKVKHS
jgi:hypothetical protein